MLQQRNQRLEASLSQILFSQDRCPLASLLALTLLLFSTMTTSPSLYPSKPEQIVLSLFCFSIISLTCYLILDSFLTFLFRCCNMLKLVSCFQRICVFLGFFNYFRQRRLQNWLKQPMCKSNLSGQACLLSFLRSATLRISS